MNTPHEILINFVDRNKIEAVSEKLLIEGIYQARGNTIHLLQEIKHNLHEGMNEIEARKLALSISHGLGVTKHWHQPYIRFGTGTALSFHEALKKENRLLPDLPYYIDLGPVWRDPALGLEYEGDYGDTFIFGENSEAQKCIDFTRTLFKEAKKKWSTEEYTGKEIYEMIQRMSHEAGYIVMEDFDGHRISDFPHQKYTLERLADIPFTPKKSLWILELLIHDHENRFGAFYEDLLL